MVIEAVSRRKTQIFDARRIFAPYVTAWSEEKPPPRVIVERPGVGIAYADETITDRDSNGVLWHRLPSRPGAGRPLFGKVHTPRQRRAMRKLLCQVCAGPADQTDDGVLWLLKDHRDDWPNWPEMMGVTEPPVCVECVRLSVRLCPALRHGAALVRARRYPVAGVSGDLYACDPTPVVVGDINVSFDDPAIRWVLAMNLARELHDCRILDLEGL